MASVFLNSSGPDVSENGTTTLFMAIGDTAFTIFANTESNYALTWRSPGTFSNMSVTISSNATVLSIAFRKNGASGNQAISVASTLTGQFSDALHSDAVVSGDKVNYQFAFTTGAIVIDSIGQVFAATTNTAKKFNIANSLASFSSASTTNFSPISGLAQLQATEAKAQAAIATAGTLANLFANISANARTTTSTIGSRIGGVSGSQIVSIATTATGIFEDNTDTDTITAGALVNYFITNGTGAGALSIRAIAMELTTTNNSMAITNSVTPAAIAAAATVWFPVGGTLTSITTEAHAQIAPGIPFTLSNISINIAVNTVTAASTFSFRKNAGGGNQSASITASGTGMFTDATHSDAILATDNIDYQLVVGGTGTSIQPGVISALMAPTQAAGGFLGAAWMSSQTSHCF